MEAHAEFGYSTLHICNNKDLEDFLEIAKDYLKNGFYFRLMFKAYAPQHRNYKTTNLGTFEDEQDGNSTSSSANSSEAIENMECSQLL